ADWNKPKSAS
ncbi:hypothetical protein D030_5398B, partial [Vibrio parahaemolyticus AQ3810]